MRATPGKSSKSYGAKIKKSLPFGAVLTLPASGSEMNNGAVITNRALNAKLPLAHPSLFPRFSVLDPKVTHSLPPVQIANGVVDAFACHGAVHDLSRRRQTAGPLREGLLLTLVEEGPRALTEPATTTSAPISAWCATLALNGLLSAGVPQDWATADDRP